MFVVELLNDQGPYAGDQVFGPFPDRVAAEAWAKADEAAGGSSFRNFYAVKKPEGAAAEDGDWECLVMVDRGRTSEAFGPFPDETTAEDWGYAQVEAEPSVHFHIFAVRSPRNFQRRE
jgi:hypothetical protein